LYGAPYDCTRKNTNHAAQNDTSALAQEPFSDESSSNRASDQADACRAVQSAFAAVIHVSEPDDGRSTEKNLFVHHGFSSR
jgi:hypothetical protein